MAQLSPQTNQKRCKKCGETKDRADFSRNKNRPDGLQDHCKACNRAYYLANSMRIAARDTEKRRMFPEINRERCRERYWRDVEASRAASRANAQVQNGKPERKSAKRAWEQADRAANPEKWRAKYREQYRKNPLVYQQIQWRRRAQKLATMSVPVTVDLLRAKWDYWAGRCWLCGGEAVEWDHVKPLSKGGSHMLVNLRPACRSCNASKHAHWPLAA